MNKLLSLIFSFCLMASIAPAQKVTDAGKDAGFIQVIGPLTEAVPFASLSFYRDVASKRTDKNGLFKPSGLGNGSINVRISAMGYVEKTFLINLDSLRKRNLFYMLERENVQLADVEIKSLSKNETLAQKAILNQVIDTRAMSAQATSLVELLNRSAGLRVRQNGGLGSPSNIMINGFQNRSIRYFKDGIPMDYLGGGFDISFLPVNSLERVEVFKGVLPGYLGADALGGAMNIVSRTLRGDAINLSYEAGSFNTHRSSVNAVHHTASGVFIGLDAFYNYTDNNYKADVKIINNTTGNLYDQNVRLFHNRFTNHYVEVFAGVADKSWANSLRIGLTYFDIDREINYGASMVQAIGAASSRQHSLIPTLRYQKTFMQGKLKLDQFLVANTITSNRIDTARGQYNWLGEFFVSDTRLGELTQRGSLAELHSGYYTSRTLATLFLSKEHDLEFNAILSGFQRSGTDPLGTRFLTTGEDVLAAKARYAKGVFSLGLNSWLLNNRIENQLVTKFYRYSTSATDANYYGAPVYNVQNDEAYGLAEAVKYTISDHSYLRGSVEWALRLPEQDEIFGDGDRKLSNYALLPEKSLNFNLGFKTSSLDKYGVEINGFYRLTKNMILQQPYNFLFSQSQNIENVKGLGVEFDGHMRPVSWLGLNGNFTYQDQRFYHTKTALMENARLSNTPYFFANVGVNISFGNLWNQKDDLQAYWSVLYVRQYYLESIPKDSEPDGLLGLWGQSKVVATNIIPDQLLNSIGLIYRSSFEPVTIGLQARNIFNKNAYDNFRIQNPGRSFAIKINYNINKF